MEQFAKAINEQLPQYLQSLPIPKSVDDAKDLTSEELIALLPLFATLVVVLFALLHLTTCKPAAAAPKVRDRRILLMNRNRAKKNKQTQQPTRAPLTPSVPSGEQAREQGRQARGEESC